MNGLKTHRRTQLYHTLGIYIDGQLVSRTVAQWIKEDPLALWNERFRRRYNCAVDRSIIQLNLEPETFNLLKEAMIKSHPKVIAEYNYRKTKHYSNKNKL